MNGNGMCLICLTQRGFWFQYPLILISNDEAGGWQVKNHKKDYLTKPHAFYDDELYVPSSDSDLSKSSDESKFFSAILSFVVSKIFHCYSWNVSCMISVQLPMFYGKCWMDCIYCIQ